MLASSEGVKNFFWLNNTKIIANWHYCNNHIIFCVSTSCLFIVLPTLFEILNKLWFNESARNLWAPNRDFFLHYWIKWEGKVWDDDKWSWKLFPPPHLLWMNIHDHAWGKICFLSHENTHFCMEGAEKVERRWQKFIFMFHRTQQLTTFSPHSRMTRDMMDLKSSPMISRLSFNNLTPCYELMYRLTSIVWMVWNVK